MKYPFLSCAAQGKNAVWRYVCSLLFATILGFVGLQWIGIPVAHAIANSIVIFNDVLRESPSHENMQSWSAYSLTISYLTTHIAYACFGVGLLLAVKVLHQRQACTLISPTARFCLKRFGLGFSVWLSLASLQTLSEFLYNQSAFTWNFQPASWFAFLPWALILTPIQTSVEELLFRGYLLQGLGLLLRQPMILTVVSGLLFAIAHFSNPEMSRGAFWIGSTYLLMGCFLSWITLRDQRLELALGVHAANNLFVVLIVNTQDSILPTPALIIQHIPSDPCFSFVSMLCATLVFYGLIFRWILQSKQDA